MANTKRIGTFTLGLRPKRARKVRRALRLKSTRRIARWISAGKRRSLNRFAEAEAVVTDPHVVRLAWADTFGRPTRADISWLGRTATIDARVLQFPHRANDQPSVPVLR